MTELIFHNRTKAEGKFLYFPQEVLDIDSEIDTSSLSKVQLDTLKCISYAFQMKDAENSFSISDLADHFDIVLDTFRNRIRGLEKLGLLEPIPFRFGNGDKGGKVTCITFTTGSNSTEANSKKSQPIARSSISDKSTNAALIASKRKASSELCAGYGLAIPPKQVLDQSEKQIIRPKGSFPIEQIVPPGKVSKKSIANSFKVVTENGTVDCKVRVFSDSRIMHASDLQNLLGVYTLIYNYHEWMLDSYRTEHQFPLNQTPVSLNHLLRIRGMAPNGKARERMRESIGAIYDTTFDLFDLANLAFIDDTLEPYVRQRYKCFEQCTPLVNTGTTGAPRIEGDRVIFGENASLFLISLPEHIFKSLLSSNYVFAFPPSSLSSPALIFSLYLRFRSRITSNKQSKDNNATYVENLKKTYSDMGATSTFGNFKTTLVGNLKQMNKANDEHCTSSLDEDNQVIYFNLWGYHGSLDLIDLTLSVDCHLEEMLHCCNVTSSSMKRPTAQNKLTAGLSFHEKMNELIFTDAARVLKPVLRRTTVTYLCVKDRKMVLTKYNSKDEIEFAIKVIAKASTLPIGVVADRVSSDLKGLRGLYIGDENRELNHDDMDTLLLLCGLKYKFVNIVDLIHSLNKMTSIHRDIEDVVWNGKSPSSKLLQVTQLFIDPTLTGQQGIAHSPTINLPSFD